MNQRNLNFLKTTRQKLRRNQTDAEKLLWSKLRNRQFFGYKFYRQYSFGKYILDFYSHQLRLSIELDGGQHNTSPDKSKDQIRTKYLNSQGVAVVRYWNNDVLKTIDTVLQDLSQKINNSPSPS